MDESADASTRLQGKSSPSPTPPATRAPIPAKFWLAVAACSLGSAFQHGFNTGVINSPQAVISEWINATYSARNKPLTHESLSLVWSVVVSIFCVGGMIGALGTGYVGNRFGRKGGLLLNNILALIGGVLEGIALPAVSPEVLILGRFFVGVNCGLNAGLAPMYLTEISPVHLRGTIGSMYQLVVTISILVSQLLSLNTVLGNESGWAGLLALTVVPVVFQVIVLPLCPESPRFTLLNQGKDELALKNLRILRGTDDVQNEIDQMKAEHSSSQQETRVTVRELFSSKSLRMPLIISAVMMLAQQLSGINAVMFFSTDIFKSAGLNDTSAQQATLGMGSMNVLMTIISVIMVEKAGRKTLMQIGMIGMTVVCVLLTITISLKDDVSWMKYLSVLLVIAFVVFFATGPGSIPWFIVGELFDQSSRSTATSIAVAVNWTANFFIGISFLPVKVLIDQYVFLFFPAVLTTFIIFTWKYVPETKNRPIEEITAYFRQNH